jgi:tRNA pseudouridine55 synthase
LGEVTTTGDSESPVIKKREIKNISTRSFDKILSKFRGKILQTPPMYSAIKHKGQPLYKLARQGIEVERSPREVNIYKLQLLEFSDNLVRLRVHCSKGTYVRTLIVDIGESLGCGAHVVALRRSMVGPYDESKMVTLDRLRQLSSNNNYEELDRFLLPIDSILVGMPELFLTSDMVHYLFLGQSVLVPHSPKSGWVRLKDKEGRFLGIGEVALDGKVAPKRMVKSTKP